MGKVIQKGRYLTLEEGEREQLKARIVVCGPGGTGKTRNALRLAYALTGDYSKIAVLDTEYNRSLMHIGVDDPEIGKIGKFGIMKLTPPFVWDRFIDALDIAEASGRECLIIDSFTHEWEGEGGISDLAAEKGGEFHSWRIPKKYHSKILERILHSPLHIILTVRAKTEYAMQEDGVTKSGKTKYKVEKIGIRPQQSNDYDYLIDFVFMLRQDHTVEILKDTPGLFTDYEGSITQEIGSKIKAWLVDGEEVESYTDIKKKAIHFIRELGESYPQMAAKLKAMEEKKKENISLWTYQEVMDLKSAFMKEVIVLMAKKNKACADKVKETQERLGKRFDQFTLDEMEEVLSAFQEMESAS